MRPPDQAGRLAILRQLKVALMQAIMPQPAIDVLFQLKDKLKRHLHEPPRKRLYQKMARLF